MIYVAINMLSLSTGFLTVALIAICIVMSLVILMQRPKNEGLGAAFGSGTTDQLFGARTTNVLQKTTRNLAVGFFVITPLLAWTISKKNHAGEANSLVKPVVEVAPVKPAEQKKDAAPAAPAAPAAQTPAPAAETAPAQPTAPAAEAPAAPAVPQETPVAPK